MMREAYRILITSGSFGSASPEAEEMLRQAGCEIIRNPKTRPLKDHELASIVRDHEIHGIIVGLDEVGPQTLGASRALKVISRHGIGVDNVDLDSAMRNGIVVTNTPATNSTAVADLVFGLILTIARNILEIHTRTQAGEWHRPMGLELMGKTLGIVGYGRIGREVAKRANGFSMKVIVYDPYIKEDQVGEEARVCPDLEETLSKSDIVTLHLPKTPETAGLFNEEMMRKMKPGAILINTSRGEVVDEEALARLVSSNYLTGAGVDVYRQEPPSDSPLMGIPGIITTSHIGALTDQSLMETSRISAENLIAVLRGEDCPYIVNQS